MKNIITKIVAGILSVAITFCAVDSELIPWLNSRAYAAGTGKYVSEIRVSYATTYKAAVAELGIDYTVIKKNFNEGLSGGVFIGYKTTDNADEAITGISVMNMDGGFNYEDYQKLLEDQKKAIAQYLDGIKPIVMEYAANYNKGLTTAKNICKVLDLYIDDFTGKGVGTLLVEAGTALNESSSDSDAFSDLSNVFLKGNNEIISNIKNLIIMAGDTQSQSGKTWAERLSAAGPEQLAKDYETKYEALGYTSADEAMEALYGDTAKTVLIQLESIREVIGYYEKSALAKAGDNEQAIEAAINDTSSADAALEDIKKNNPDATEADLEALKNVIEANTASDNTIDVIGYAFATRLKELTYGEGKTLYDFFMRTDLTETDLYPMVYELSAGQKAQIGETGLVPIFQAGLIKNESNEELDKLIASLAEKKTVSVYEGVNLSLFEGDVAITGEGIKSMTTSGAGVEALISFLSNDVALYATIGIFVLSSAVFIGTTIIERSALKYYKDVVAWANKIEYMNNAESLNFSAGGFADEEGAIIDYTEKLRNCRNARGVIKVIRYVSAVVAIVAGVVLLAFAAAKIYNRYFASEEVVLTDIPLYMVDMHETDGGTEYIYYSLALTKDGKKADIHNATSGEKQWLAIYTTKDKKAGKPIAANVFCTTNGSYSDKNSNYEAVKLFGVSTPLDFADEAYTGKEDLKYCYLYISRNVNASAAGSVFGNGVTPIILAGSILLIAAGTAIILTRRKKMAASK